MWQSGIVVRDPELVKKILVKDFHVFNNNWLECEEWIDPIFGNNPFVLKDQKWKYVRNQVTPQLTSAKV